MAKKYSRVTILGDGVVAFLCTPDAAFLNGQRIEICGGRWCSMYSYKKMK